MRVLALYLPDIACEMAILRRESQAGIASALGNQAPLGVVVAPDSEPLSGKSVLFAVTERARRLGVRAGQTVASARSLAGELDVQQIAPSALEASLGRVAEVLLGLSPTVSVQAPDTVLLDVSGLAHLYGNEAALLDEACDRAKALGHRVRGAIADGVYTARAVARFAPIPRVVVPAGNDEKALGPLPVAALPIDDEVQSYLGRLGLFNVDDVKKQPIEGLAARLGERAPLVIELLHGRDRTPLVPYEPPRVIVESLSWDEAIAGSEALLFVLRGLLGRVAARLLGRGEATTQLVVELGLDVGIVRARDRERQASEGAPLGDEPTATPSLVTTESLSFHFPVPISQANELLRAVHTRVERLTQGETDQARSGTAKRGLLAPVVRLAVVADGIVRAPRVQLDLSRDTTVSPEALPVLLAELTADLGEDKIGKLGLEPSHLIEERSRLVPFYDAPPGATKTKGRGAKHKQLSLLTKAEEPIAPPTRLLRAPLVLTGTLVVGSFVTIASVGRSAGKNVVPAAFTVKRVQRTERIEDAAWWSGKPQTRDYALAYLEGEAGGVEALVVRERRSGKVAVHGFYLRKFALHEPPLMVLDPAWRSWFGKPNTPDASFVTGTNLEVVRAFFPEVPPSLKPELRLVMGPVCAGKTRYRNDECFDLVPVDPVDVYLALTDDGKAIPRNIGELVARVGEDVAAMAVKERRSIVIELIPTDDIAPKIDDLIRAAKARRYTVKVAKLEATNAQSQERHAARPKTSISALHVQADAVDWLMRAFYPGLKK